MRLALRERLSSKWFLLRPFRMGSRRIENDHLLGFPSYFTSSMKSAYAWQLVAVLFRLDSNIEASRNAVAAISLEDAMAGYLHVG